MTVATILNDLLNDRLILSEVFHSGHKIHFGHKESYVEVYKNPDLGEVDNVVEAAEYDGAKIGVDSKGDVYVWVDDVLHAIMEKALQMEFVLRFDYTKNNPILFTASGVTATDWKKYSTPELTKRLKKIFPEIKTIEQVSRPFVTLYKYDA
jgi:hypothetical protein